MLRSVDIPAKLAMGYGALMEYHAWNQVYLRTVSNGLLLILHTMQVSKIANQKKQMGKN